MGKGREPRRRQLVRDTEWQCGLGGGEWEPGSWAEARGRESPALSLPTQGAAGGHSDIAFLLTQKAFTGPTHQPGVV